MQVQVLLHIPDDLIQVRVGGVPELLVVFPGSFDRAGVLIQDAAVPGDFRDHLVQLGPGLPEDLPVFRAVLPQVVKPDHLDVKFPVAADRVQGDVKIPQGAPVQLFAHFLVQVCAGSPECVAVVGKLLDPPVGGRGSCVHQLAVMRAAGVVSVLPVDSVLELLKIIPHIIVLRLPRRLQFFAVS